MEEQRAAHHHTSWSCTDDARDAGYLADYLHAFSDLYLALFTPRHHSPGVDWLLSAAVLSHEK